MTVGHSEAPKGSEKPRDPLRPRRGLMVCFLGFFQLSVSQPAETATTTTI